MSIPLRARIDPNGRGCALSLSLSLDGQTKHQRQARLMLALHSKLGLRVLSSLVASRFRLCLLRHCHHSNPGAARPRLCLARAPQAQPTAREIPLCFGITQTANQLLQATIMGRLRVWVDNSRLCGHRPKCRSPDIPSSLSVLLRVPVIRCNGLTISDMQKGKMLNYPAGHRCDKCRNSGFKAYDPSNPCKKVRSPRPLPSFPLPLPLQHRAD